MRFLSLLLLTAGLCCLEATQPNVSVEGPCWDSVNKIVSAANENADPSGRDFKGQFGSMLDGAKAVCCGGGDTNLETAGEASRVLTIAFYGSRSLSTYELAETDIKDFNEKLPVLLNCFHDRQIASAQ